MNKLIVSLALGLTTATLVAAPVTYNLDPNHSYPSFAADHMGGLSVWRGKFTKTSGRVVLDRDAQSGAITSGNIDVTVDTSSIDFGNEKLNEHARSDQIFDVAKFPTATFVGTISKFKSGKPVEAKGTFTLHGVAKPLTLVINSLLCKPHPVSKKEVCGADASAVLDRSQFGVDYGKQYGFKMDVTLQIQVEAIRAD